MRLAAVLVAVALCWGTHVVITLHLLWHGPVSLAVASALAVVVETALLDRGAATVRRLGR